MSARLPLRERAARRSARDERAPAPSRPHDRIDVRARFPGIVAAVSVCGAASNAGKTWLCERILAGLREAGLRSVALKVTRTHLGDCPRGVETCGTCDGLDADFEIVRDGRLLDVPGKDTARYRAAGADRVLWLLVKPRAIKQGLLAALAEVPDGSVLVAEGNSFRDYASADATLMALSTRGELKPSARHVLDRVDAFVRPCFPSSWTGSEGHPDPRPLIAAADAWTFVRERVFHRAGRRDG